MKDAQGHGSNGSDTSAHQQGVAHVGATATSPSPYWGMVKVGNGYQTSGPHDSREAARDSARGINPGAKSVTTGYGSSGPNFNIQSHSAFEK